MGYLCSSRLPNPHSDLREGEEVSPLFRRDGDGFRISPQELGIGVLL
jgi:hypothetical protein